MNLRNVLLFAFVAALIVIEGMTASWNTALGILNMGLISAILALGVNMQWGYAGLFNVGVVGFVALGGLAPVLISTPPVTEVWTAGGAYRLILGAASRGRGHRARHRAQQATRRAEPGGRASGRTDRRFLPLPRGLRPGGRRGGGVQARDLFQYRRARPAGASGLAGGRASRRRRCLDHRQDRARASLRLPRHRDARHRRDHHRCDEERGLAGARGEERHLDPAPGALRDQPAGQSRLSSTGRRGSAPIR